MGQISIMKKMHSIPITVEFEDVDSYNIVHHVKMVAYLERSRLRFLLQMGCDLYAKEMSIIIYKLDMRYIAPAKLLDSLIITTYVESLDDYRINLGHKIIRDKKTLVRAHSGIAFMNNKSEEILPAPYELLKNLNNYK